MYRVPRRQVLLIVLAGAPYLMARLTALVWARHASVPAWHVKSTAKAHPPVIKKLYTLGAPVCPVPVWFWPLPAIGGCALIPMLRLLHPRVFPLPAPLPPLPRPCCR